MSEVTSIEFDSFALERLEAVAAAQGVTVDELVRHAVMYYLADLDSGRTAVRPVRHAAGSDRGRREIP